MEGDINTILILFESIREDGKISDFNNTCSVNTCEFNIIGFKDEPTHESFKLVKSVGLGNMVLLNEEDFMIKFYDQTV